MIRIPKTLVLLGEPIEIVTDSGDIWNFQRGKFYFASSMSGRELWILPRPTSQTTVKEIPKDAAKLFKRFTGWHPDKAFRFAEDSFSAKSFGFAESVAYRSNKWTGKQVGYIHTFENSTPIQVDNKNTPGVWRLSGIKLKVEARGITG